MEIDPEIFRKRADQARQVYGKQREIYCPYFTEAVVLNSDGFHHLQFSARRERSKLEQLLKFRLLPLALEIIRKSGTVQEYRKILSPIGKKSKREGSVPHEGGRVLGLFRDHGRYGTQNSGPHDCSADRQWKAGFLERNAPLKNQQERVPKALIR